VHSNGFEIVRIAIGMLCYDVSVCMVCMYSLIKGRIEAYYEEDTPTCIVNIWIQ